MALKNLHGLVLLEPAIITRNGKIVRKAVWIEYYLSKNLSFRGY